jgi:pimeloyl-ACP methyl ester carboxylesterase
MALEIKEEKGFKYIDEGAGQPMILLHGLFGALSNWECVVDTFSDNYRVLIPLLPVYDMPLKQSGLDGLVVHLEKFVALKALDKMILVGNSLGGHVGLIYTLAHQPTVDKLVLTGSSGLFENTMGGSFPKRGSYEYIKERIEYTFYDPKTATKELIDEVFETTKSIPKCLRIVAMAKSAQRHNMAKELHKIKVPTLLVWGLNDTITPPMVGHEFNKLIPNSELSFIDKCCHAPMMERADEFNTILKGFLNTH